MVRDRSNKSSDSKEPDKEKPDKDKPESNNGLVTEFLQSAAYYGLQSSAKGAVQIADQITGSKLADKIDFVSEPGDHDLGTSKWWAQELGAAVGMAGPALLLSYGMGKTLKAFGKAPTEGAIGAESLKREMAKGAAAGFIYEGVFSPTDKAKDGADFAYQRIASGIVGATSFAALTGATYGIGKFADSKVIQNREFASSYVAPVLKNPAAQGILSGVPAGFISAQGDSLVTEKRLATTEEIQKSVASMSLFGGLFSMHKRNSSVKNDLTNPSPKHTDAVPQSLKPDKVKPTDIWKY